MSGRGEGRPPVEPGQADPAERRGAGEFCLDSNDAGDEYDSSAPYFPYDD